MALERLVDTEAMTIATNTIFLGSTLVFALAAMMIWLAPSPKGPVDLSAVH